MQHSPEVPSAGRGDRYDVLFADVWSQSEATIRARVGSIEAVAVAVLQGTLDHSARLEALNDAHQLAGSLGTFGLGDGSRLARQIELLLQVTRPLTQDEAYRLSELVVGLNAALPARFESPPSSQPTDQRAWRGEVRLLVVGADEEMAERVIEEAAGAGLEAEWAADLPLARDALARLHPNAVVVDLASAPSSELGRGFLAAATAGAPAVLVVLADAATLGDRMQAARSGADVFLTKPTTPQAVVEAVRGAFERLTRATVLAVDDDPAVLAVLSGALSEHDFRVEVLEDPRRFWDVLEEVVPDLLLLDAEMLAIDAFDLCRAVRNAPRWGRLPIVFVGAAADRNRLRAMFAAGADDHIPKPISTEDVVIRVVNRLERTRALLELSRRDLHTGLLTRQALTAAIERQLAIARRHGVPVSVVVLKPDALDPYAEMAIAHVVRTSIREEDVVGMWDSPVVAAGLYGLSLNDAVERVTLALEEIRLESSTASAGVAQFPTHGHDVAALMTAAETALSRALALGGDRIVAAASSAPAKGAAMDILLIDDDEAVGSLLVHALTTRGWRTHWVRDGAQADAMLTRAVRLDARVVLLDVGLPGLDGMSLLRRLAAEGVLVGTRVIMLTVRTTESEVLEALQLGAFDHVAKPFSVPVLLYRIQRALDSLPS